MVALFSTAVIAITVGVYMCIRSDCFMRVPPSNDCIKTTSGTSGGVKQSSREDLEYFNYNENIHRNKNVYVLSK